MRKLAAQLGVPAEDIVLDYAGRRTYDSCYRAKEIFGVKQVVIVTQRFHLDRSLFLCDALGVASVGMVADRRVYQTYRWWELREVVATAAAWWDVNIGHPVPVLGEKLPIKVN
jgi:SanA protein